MNPGGVLILISLMLSIAALVFFARGSSRPGRSMIAARRLYYGAGACILVAAGLLVAAFVLHRFEYAYVFNYSSRDLPLAYLIAGFWAGQEGSMLLWVMLLFLCGIAVIRSGDEDEGIILSIIAITQIFILFILSMHSPFRYVWQAGPEGFQPGVIPPDGSGLNPLLQDFWMIIHPPVLFAGYAAAVLPFAYAVAALVRGDYQSWAHRARRWVLLSTTTLGVGIFLGGYWAYKVLGWGGYWGWDPVENSSLIPWIVLLALMHGLIVQRRRRALVKTNLLLALAGFILVLYATFLTRSGVLSNFSVHSFGDLGVTKHLLFFMLFYVAISLFLFLRKMRGISSGPLAESSLSWDSLVVYGMITLAAYAALVLVGTSMPILSSIFSDRPFSVQTSYYNNMTIPLGILILAFIALVQIVQLPAGMRVRPLIALGVFSMVAGVLFNVFYTTYAPAYLFSAGAIFIFALSGFDLARRGRGALLPSRLGHAGLALLVLGTASSSVHSISFQKELYLGNASKFGPVSIVFNGITDEEKSSLLFTLRKNGNTVEMRTPYYIDKKMGSLYREPAIRYGLLSDVYISPMEYRSGMERLTRLELAKRTPLDFGGMRFTFEGFDVDRAHMTAGEVVVRARLWVSSGGAEAVVSPGVHFSAEGARTAIDAAVPWGGRRVRLLDFDVNSGRIYLHVDPPRGAALPPDTALVDVSFKRLIWLVWLGTVLITCGGIVALAQRRARSDGSSNGNGGGS